MYLIEDDVLAQLQELKSVRAHLGSAMVQAAEELRERGTEPPGDLLAQLQRYRHLFCDVQRQIGARDGEPSSLSLDDLERRHRQGRQHQAALSVVSSAEELQHCEVRDFASLSRLQADCRELRAALLSDAPPADLATALLEGRHPVAAVVALVSQAAEMTDEAWGQLQDRVQSHYGRELATAVVRGRIVPKTNG